jgi:hypothetical protein
MCRPGGSASTRRLFEIAVAANPRASLKFFRQSAGTIRIAAGRLAGEIDQALLGKQGMAVGESWSVIRKFLRASEWLKNAPWIFHAISSA